MTSLLLTFGVSTAYGKPAILDEDMASVIQALHELKPKPIVKLSPQEARLQPTVADAARKILQDKKQPIQEDRLSPSRDIKVQTRLAALPARVYTPQGDGPFPLIVYFHGGGWVIGSLDKYDSSARALANHTNAVVLAVHYRQAPEHPFPAAVEDAYGSMQWAFANSTSLNVDSTKIAVAGESAGGNLATVSCLVARDRGGKMPVHQLLIYPILNSELATESYKEFANAEPLNKEMMKWFFANYLKDTPRQGNFKYVSPLNADLEGLPPTTIITAEIDPLLSEASQYAERLRKTGIAVTHRTFQGVTHEFFGLGNTVRDALQAEKFAGDQLKTAFMHAAPKSN